MNIIETELGLLLTDTLFKMAALYGFTFTDTINNDGESIVTYIYTDARGNKVYVTYYNADGKIVSGKIVGGSMYLYDGGRAPFAFMHDVYNILPDRISTISQ